MAGTRAFKIITDQHLSWELVKAKVSVKVMVGRSVKIKTQVKVGIHRQSPGSLSFGQRAFR